jgi:hypothetical protein
MWHPWLPLISLSAKHAHGGLARGWLNRQTFLWKCRQVGRFSVPVLALPLSRFISLFLRSRVWACATLVSFLTHPFPNLVQLQGIWICSHEWQSPAAACRRYKHDHGVEMQISPREASSIGSSRYVTPGRASGSAAKPPATTGYHQPPPGTSAVLFHAGTLQAPGLPQGIRCRFFCCQRGFFPSLSLERSSDKMPHRPLRRYIFPLPHQKRGSQSHFIFSWHIPCKTLRLARHYPTAVGLRCQCGSVHGIFP